MISWIVDFCLLAAGKNANDCSVADKVDGFCLECVSWQVENIHFLFHIETGVVIANLFFHRFEVEFYKYIWYVCVLYLSAGSYYAEMFVCIK